MLVYMHFCHGKTNQKTFFDCFGLGRIGEGYGEFSYEIRLSGGPI